MPPVSAEESYTKIQGKNPNLQKENVKSKMYISLKNLSDETPVLDQVNYVGHT